MAETLRFYSELEYRGRWSNFKIEKYVEQYKDSNYPFVLLIRDNGWNDQGYVTHFELYLVKELEDVEYIGTTRIIEPNEGNKKTTEIPTKFEKLDKTKFISRGLKNQFYSNLASNPEIKKKVLDSLNDLHYHQYSRDDITKINPNFYDPYSKSLFRGFFSESSISSSYAKDSSEILDKIEKLIEAIYTEKIQEQEIMSRLLYGSIVTCLESYLGDAFRYHIFSNQGYFSSFLRNYTFPKGDKKYSWRELGLKGDKIEEYIRQRIKGLIDDISFHNLEKVNELYLEILNVDLPRNWVAINRDVIPKRHDIFHRNGKNVAGEIIKIGKNDLVTLLDEIRKFIAETERILLTQT